MKFLPLFLAVSALLVSVCEFVASERILVLAFTSSKSHKITYMRLIEELASRGHEITVLTPVKPFKTVANIKEVYTYDVESAMFGKFNPFEMKEKNQSFNPLQIIGDLETVCRTTYALPQVQEVLEQEFDLVFMQPAINECALGAVWKLGAPLVLFSVTSVPEIISSRMGTRLPPSFVPHLLMDFSTEMTFWERFKNFSINVIYDLGAWWIYEPVMEKAYREMLGDESIPSIRTILGNASLLLSNGHFSISGPRPYLQDVIDVGGIHSKPAKPLPEDLEKFVTKPGSKGFIYFSLGSIVKTDDMPEAKRLIFLRVFSQLKDYQIVWKWNDEEMVDKPPNVLISSWLPQQDILGHKDIKMFITHCGLGGLEEAIYHGVPLLGTPFMGDQPLNAKQGRRLGILYDIDWNDLTEERLLDGIYQVLFNPKYRDNVQRLSTVFRDQPDDPLARGVYWIEYVMRFKGAPQLRSASRNLNYFQYHSWDIISTYIILAWIAIYIFYTVFRLIISKACSLICPSTRGPDKTKYSSVPISTKKKN